MSSDAPPIDYAPPRKKGMPVWMGILIGCGALSVICCLGIGGLFGVQLWGLRDAVPESKAFVKRAVPAFTQPWSFERLKEVADPSVFDTNWKPAIDALAKKMGPLTRFNADEPKRWFARFYNSDHFVELSYEVDFEKGPGELNLILRKTPEGWRIYRVHVHSPLLLK